PGRPARRAPTAPGPGRPPSASGWTSVSPPSSTVCRVGYTVGAVRGARPTSEAHLLPAPVSGWHRDCRDYCQQRPRESPRRAKRRHQVNRPKHILAVVILTGAIFGMAAQPAFAAGRLGGPAAESGTIVPGDSVYFDIPFTLGRAVVSVAGNG